jgi:hypothetical protein
MFSAKTCKATSEDENVFVLRPEINPEATANIGLFSAPFLLRFFD